MTTSIIISDYIAAGYFVTKYAARKEWMSAGLLPAKLLSLSDYVAPLAPTTYPLNPSVESYEAYGISVETIPTLKQWWDENQQKEIGWQNAFYTLEFARGFVDLFVRKREDVVILGSAIHRKYVSLLLEGYEPPYAGCGVEEVVAKGARPSTGEVLGFDILSYEYCRFDSWVPYSYPPVIHEELNIKPNTSGFLNTLEEADRCDQFMAASNDMSLHGWWLPWLMIKYPLGDE